MKREKRTEQTNSRVYEPILKSPQNFVLPTFVFLIGVTFSHLSLAKTASCPADAIPIQAMGEYGIAHPYISHLRRVNGKLVNERPKPQPIQVINGKIIRNDPKTTLAAIQSLQSHPEPVFFDFMKTVTAHIAMRLSKEKICINTDQDDGSSLVQFVEWSLSANEAPITEIPSLDIAGVSASCRVFSPWIDIVFDRKSTPHLQATIRWNERQFLTDQAILSGEKNVPRGIPKPIKGSEYRKFKFDYAAFAGSAAIGKNYNRPTAEQIEAQIPKDVLWIFRRGYGYEGVPEGEYSAREVMKKRPKSYTKIVTTLIDRCFSSTGEDIRYNTIFDVADLISLDKYQIKEAYIGNALSD